MATRVTVWGMGRAKEGTERQDVVLLFGPFPSHPYKFHSQGSNLTITGHQNKGLSQETSRETHTHTKNENTNETNMSHPVNPPQKIKV